MSFELFKWLIVPVLIERDADGAILREFQGVDQPLNAYNREQLDALVESLEAQIDERNTTQNGGTNVPG